MRSCSPTWRPGPPPASTLMPGIRISVNGEELSVPSGSTLADLLRQLALDQRRVAVEHNRRVVPRA